MCPTTRVSEHVDPREGMPCRVCGSGNHGTHSHTRLEETYERYEPWEIGSRLVQEELLLEGNGGVGAPIRLERSSGPPDQVRIVRSSISGAGFSDSPVVGAAVLRLWREDGAGGFTFMLSSDQMTAGECRSLERLCGDRGTGVSVAVAFSRTTQSEVRSTT